MGRSLPRWVGGSSSKAACGGHGLIATWLFATTGTSISIAVYVAALAVLSFVCAYVAAETYQIDIEAEQAEERQLIREAEPGTR